MAVVRVLATMPRNTARIDRIACKGVVMGLPRGRYCCRLSPAGGSLSPASGTIARVIDRRGFPRFAGLSPPFHLSRSVRAVFCQLLLERWSYPDRQWARRAPDSLRCPPLPYSTAISPRSSRPKELGELTPHSLPGSSRSLAPTSSKSKGSSVYASSSSRTASSS
jgi:hypothetical protein